MKHIALIACGKTKAPVPSPARDLYQGDLFQKTLAYAERVLKADEIFALGQIRPGADRPAHRAVREDAEPRERAEKREWADRVLAQLRDVADLDRDRFTILAGENYRRYLIPNIRNYELPLKGLMFGQQLSFLAQATANV